MNNVDAGAGTLRVQVRKRIGNILLDADLAFDAGVTTVVGPSGAGKSTLLRLIAGLARPDHGAMRLGATLLDDAATGYHLSPGQRRIGLVFQEYALFPHLTVFQNVAYGLAARGVPRRARRIQVGAMLDRLAIAGLAGEHPSRLSGGQRQRVALARALVLDPSVLLLDEPLAALDVQTRSSVRHQLQDVLGDLHVPCLLVTHDYADVLAFQRRVVILVDGKVVQDGAHADLLAHPRTKFVADFTGVNFYAGTLGEHDALHLATVDVAPDVRIHVMAEDVPSGPVSLALKPWDVTLSVHVPDGSARNVLGGIVRQMQPSGGRVRVLLKIGESGVPLVAEISHDAMASLGCAPGQALFAAFKATALSVEPA